MAVNAKIIRRRIKSVGNTKKITKAMELVAAAKMRKAVRSALSTRSYAILAREMLMKLAGMKRAAKHRLMEIRPVKKILLVIISSNRGLCGGFNANVFKKVVEQVKNANLIAVQRSFGKRVLPQTQQVKIEAMTIGKKSEKTALKLGLKVIASFNNLADTPSLSETKPIVEIIKESFEKKKFDKVAIVYTDYISAINQKPTIRQVLPISPVDLEKMLRDLGENMIEEDLEAKQNDQTEFIFEPNSEWVLEQMLPRLVEVQIFQALLESSASEQSARMMAMRNASDAAEEMIGDLVFTLNQARQAGITREIAEISGGAAALE